MNISGHSLELDSTTIVDFNKLQFHPYLRAEKEKGNWHFTAAVNKSWFPADDLFSSLPKLSLIHISQRTGEAYKGFRKGRWWNLESTDIDRLRSQVKEVEIITPSVARWGSKAVYEDKKYDCSVKGLYPDYLHIESQEMAYGRFKMCIRDSLVVFHRQRRSATFHLW